MIIAFIIVLCYFLCAITCIAIAFYRLRKLCPDITKEEVKHSKGGNSFRKADRYFSEVENFKGVCLFSIFQPFFLIFYLGHVFFDVCGPHIVDRALNLLWKLEPKTSEVEKLRKELEELKKKNFYPGEEYQIKNEVK